MNEKILVSVNNETICNFKFQDAKKLPGKIEFAMTFDIKSCFVLLIFLLRWKCSSFDQEENCLMQIYDWRHVISWETNLVNDPRKI